MAAKLVEGASHQTNLFRHPQPARLGTSADVT
jgi:hypothetical protein